MTVNWCKACVSAFATYKVGAMALPHYDLNPASMINCCVIAIWYLSGDCAMVYGHLKYIKCSRFKSTVCR